MTSIADVLARTKPATRTVPICIDGTIAERLDEVRARHLDAVRESVGMADSTISDVVAEVAALEAEADTATVTFTVTSIGSKAWRALSAEHPPAVDDVEGWRWNPETFPVAAVAAATVEPAMSEIEADQLAQTLSDGQWSKLFGAVLAVNVGDDLIPKSGLGTSETPSSEPSSTTAPPEESPISSS